MKPLILISNDDSIHANGIQALIDMVAPYGDLVVVAPEEPQSGKSQALTSDMPIRIRQVSNGGKLAIYACTGTPTDCVKLAMSRILERIPDLLVSGINHGANSSVSVLYSGTMGAAIEGALHGIPSIGFSLCNSSANADFSTSIVHGRKIVESVLKNGMSEGIALNVNIPNKPLNEIKGIKVCRQNKGRWIEGFDKRVDPFGKTYYWMAGRYENLEPKSTDTDEAYLDAGYVSVVPTQIDMTAYSTLNKLKEELE